VLRWMEEERSEAKCCLKCQTVYQQTEVDVARNSTALRNSIDG